MKHWQGLRVTILRHVMKKLQSISILGCGWLGLPLAMHYLEKGCLVKGSTRTKGKMESLRNAGIIPYIIDLKEEGETDEIADFFASDLLIINFPPARTADIETISCHPDTFV